MTFSLDFRAHSEVGLVRRNNQDSGYASPTMLMVADGMGGAAAGDLASTVAIREILKSDAHYELDQTAEVLAGALSRANHSIADLVQADPALDGMGTTVCGALFTGTDLGMVHIGDSRGYLLRDGVLHRLTHDHSWVQSLVDEGKISLDEAAVHPHRSLLLKVLNGQGVHEPDLDRVELMPDDRLLFCSDGLCGFVPDEVIRQIMLQSTDLDDAMAQLVAAAHRGGGADNITVLLADVLPHSEALAALEPVIVGAALDGEVPEIEEHTLVGLVLDESDLTPEPHATGERVVEEPDRRVLSEAEATRYAPKGGRRGPLVTGLALVAGIALVLGGGGYGAWHYSRTQYFVGTQDEQVAIFRGVPGEILGVPLSEVAEPSTVRVGDLPVFFQQQVRTTIPVSNLDAAHTTVAQLRTRADACIRKRASANTQPSAPGGSASASGSPSGTPGPTLSADPATPGPGLPAPHPSASESAPSDLEEC
ncbi:protein phosphatase 2C domain-containing protein [Luteococcus sp. H138]|uniref:PP2C family protein-serine/threonine phosphatase n=1 Tax=unclassified Luteococcus TaxID=2639923 RepID=UPI00313D25EF